MRQFGGFLVIPRGRAAVHRLYTETKPKETSPSDAGCGPGGGEPNTPDPWHPQRRQRDECQLRVTSSRRDLHPQGGEHSFVVEAVRDGCEDFERDRGARQHYTELVIVH